MLIKSIYTEQQNAKETLLIYGIMTTGKIPQKPKPPGKMKYNPIASEPSRSTIKLQWEAPSEGDAPIQGYKIKRRAGVSNLCHLVDSFYFALANNIITLITG